jgi:hypothetical protein
MEILFLSTSAAAADYMSSKRSRYRGFKGNQVAFAAVTRDGSTQDKHCLSGGNSLNFCSEEILAL